MQSQLWLLFAISLLSATVSAKAISIRSLRWRMAHDYEADLQRAASAYDGELARRSVSTTGAAAAATTSSMVNTTQIATACMSAVSSMTTVTNAAGFAGCYNILAWNPATSMFQADLRIYQQGPAAGGFENVSASGITVMLTFPEGTQYSAMVKRGVTQLHKRADGSIVQSQQFSLAGNVAQQAGTAKLNETLLASLMVPQITLQATIPSTQNTISTNMTVSDSAYFVAGEFTDIAKQAPQFANPATATAAVAASKGFVLPGTTFGIFPTGLIVTSIWTIAFFVAFGLGTVGRIRSRDLYRKRIVGLAARQKV